MVCARKLGDFLAVLIQMKDLERKTHQNWSYSPSTASRKKILEQDDCFCFAKKIAHREMKPIVSQTNGKPLQHSCQTAGCGTACCIPEKQAKIVF